MVFLQIILLYQEKKRSCLLASDCTELDPSRDRIGV